MMRLLSPAALAVAGALAACTVAPGPEDDMFPPPAYDDSGALEAAIADLEESGTAEYACGQDAAEPMGARFMGQDTIVEITMPSLKAEPVLLACMSTRVGPECSSGDMRARFDIVHDRAMIWETGTGLEIACRPATPAAGG